ncbi:MAG: HAD-IIIC family phosphatase [Syntrophobacteraceae bacterium]
MKFQAEWPLKTINVRVHRNHAFEPVASILEPYGAFGGWHAEFTYSDYSDALDFSENSGNWDAEFVWLDRSRYDGLDDPTMFEWLTQRLGRLRGISAVPIIVMLTCASPSLEADLEKAADGVPACHIARMSEIADMLGNEFLDTRLAKLSGTALSGRTLTDLAREIACKWLPGAIFPPIKAVALDLDHTLYRGVLGEDGIDGIELTPGHKELQSYLKELRMRGVFLALVSRNERQDVEELFHARKDFPLAWADFSATEIRWGDKADGILAIAERLRIALDAILYVDDNPGELRSVAMRLPGLPILHAPPDAFATMRSVKYYPALWRWRSGKDDSLRVDDLKASEARSALLARAANEDEYFAGLDVHLELALDPMARLARLAELSQKTNQFNIALRRIPETEMASYLQSGESAVVSVSLRDRLSDSGLICMMVVQRSGENLDIEELCVSCRALGRRLENIIIGEAVSLAQRKLGKGKVRCRWRTGPRNQPALKWLRQASGDPLESEEGISTLEGFGPPSLPAGITVSIWENSNDPK